jgi:hypothetical protein
MRVWIGFSEHSGFIKYGESPALLSDYQLLIELIKSSPE